MKNLRVYIKRGSAFLAAIALAGTLTGCVKNMDCDIKDSHAHKYVSGTGLTAYRISEKQHVGDLNWTDETIPLTQEIVDMADNQLLRISDNVNELNKITAKNASYTQYEYSYYEDNLALGIALDNLALGLAMSGTRYDWTTDIEHADLTGNAQDVEYRYYGYRFGFDKKGKKELQRSPLVDDLLLIASEYPYFKMNEFYELNYGDTYSTELVKK